MAILPCNGDGDGPRPSPSTASASNGCDGSLIQQSCNGSYTRMIKNIGDLQDDVVRYRAIQILLLISCVGVRLSTFEHMCLMYMFVFRGLVWVFA